MTPDSQTDAGKRTPTTVLKDEHRVIETVLDALERVAPSDPIDADFVRSALDFFRSYADRFHHAKEEDELFPVLEKSGIPRQGGPIGCMLDEHEQGRAHLRTIADNLDAAAGGDAAALGAVRESAAGYVALLRNHIQKENQVLFVLADQVLSADQQAAVSQAFDRAEQRPENVGKEQRYVALAQDLSQRSQQAG